MTWGRWSEIYHAYKLLYNFETKKLLYTDIEQESEEYRRTHQKIDDIREL